MWTSVRLALFAILGGMVSASCGYALAGRGGGALPPGIVTIGVPQCANESAVPEIDRPMTEALRTEFQSRGRYRVLPQAEGVDAVLTCRIVNVASQPIDFTVANQVSRSAIIVTVALEFRQITGDRVIWANGALSTRDEYDVSTTTANDVSSFANNQNAVDRLSKSFARAVVSSIFDAF